MVLSFYRADNVSEIVNKPKQWFHTNISSIALIHKMIVRQGTEAHPVLS